MTTDENPTLRGGGEVPRRALGSGKRSPNQNRHVNQGPAEDTVADSLTERTFNAASRVTRASAGRAATLTAEGTASKHDSATTSESRDDDETPADTTVEESKTGVSKRKLRVRSMRELWQHAYEKPSITLQVSREDLAGLRPKEGELFEIRELISARAREDAANQVPFRVLVAVLDSTAQREVRQRAGELAAHALAEGAGLGSLLSWPLPKDSATPQQILETARAAAKGRGLTDVRATTAGEYALRTFSLLLVMSTHWNTASVARNALGLLGSPSQLQRSKEYASAAAVLNAMDRDALALLTEVMLSEAKKVERRASEAEREAQRRAAEGKQLRAVVDRAAAREDGLREQLARREDEVITLRATLTETQQKGAVDRSHLADDFETLRGEVLRKLSGQTELLSDGLHALRAGHIEIADEYVDRALRAITAEVARLRDNGRAVE